MTPDRIELHNHAMGLLRAMVDDINKDSLKHEEDIAFRAALVRHAKGMLTAYGAWLDRKKSRQT